MSLGQFPHAFSRGISPSRRFLQRRRGRCDRKPERPVARLDLQYHGALVPQVRVAAYAIGADGDDAYAPIAIDGGIVHPREIDRHAFSAGLGNQANGVIPLRVRGKVCRNAPQVAHGVDAFHALSHRNLSAGGHLALPLNVERRRPRCELAVQVAQFFDGLIDHLV